MGHKVGNGSIPEFRFLARFGIAAGFPGCIITLERAFAYADICAIVVTVVLVRLGIVQSTHNSAEKN
jgi:hypothetical protein